MEYKVPEVTALAKVIDAVQAAANKGGLPPLESPTQYDSVIGAYEDWE